MPYDETRDPYADTGATIMANGSKGLAVVPSDEEDLAQYVKAISLETAGDVSYIPIDNADDEPRSYEGLPAGWVSPHRVRRVMETGTTARVVTVED